MNGASNVTGHSMLSGVSNHNSTPTACQTSGPGVGVSCSSTGGTVGGATGAVVSGGSVCPSCGSMDIDVDRSRGNAVCTGCGQVLEHTMIVNDTEFVATGVGDSKRAIGQFVGANDRGMRSSFAGFHPGMQQEQLEISMEKGRKLILQQASVLSIHTHCSDLAQGFYKMLVERKFTRGRRTPLIAASCLYLACRNEQLPYLLFDFSDQLEESVTDLGRMYLRIAQELCINPPTIDPCLYIERFAERLDFAEETKDVAMTAMRILSRMKRDWIAAGRRPFGLCGASLFLAAKMHGFERSLQNIVKVVGAQVVTMAKRLKEFKHTATSKLTIEEFYMVDLEEEHDPPSFHEQKKRMALKLPQFSEEEFQKLDCEIERNLSMERAKAHSRQLAAAGIGANSQNSCNDLNGATNQSATGYGIDLSVDMGLPKDTLTSVDCEIDGVTDIIHEAISSRRDRESPEPEGTGHLPVTCESLGIDPLNPNADALGGYSQNGAMRESESQNGVGESTVTSGVNGSELDSSGLPTGSETVEREGGGCESIELFVDDLDDCEIDSYLLTEEESKRKAVLWTAAYGEFMERRAAKRKLQEEEKERNRSKAARTHKPRNQGDLGTRRARKLKSDRPAATANEAIDSIIKLKNISEKINVDVLKDLRIEKPTVQTSTSNSITNGTSLSATSNNSSPSSLVSSGAASSSLSASLKTGSLDAGKLTSRLASAFRKGSRPNITTAANSKNFDSSKSGNSSTAKSTLKDIDMFAQSAKR